MVFLGVGQERSHNVVTYLKAVVNICSRCFECSVDVGNMSCKFLIKFNIGLVKKQENQIEAGQKCGREIDIIMRVLTGVIPSVNRVSCGEYGCTSVETGCDTSLCNGYSLLFHNFMNVGTISFVHFVELIDAADSSICKDKCATF